MELYQRLSLYPSRAKSLPLAKINEASRRGISSERSLQVPSVIGIIYSEMVRLAMLLLPEAGYELYCTETVLYLKASHLDFVGAALHSSSATIAGYGRLLRIRQCVVRGWPAMGSRSCWRLCFHAW